MKRTTTLGSTRSAVDSAEQARQAMARLEQVIRGPAALRDPGQGYLLMGVVAQLGRSLELSMTHLGRWWQGQQNTRSLEVTEGPFADDPAAAVSTAIAALAAAATACAELTSALERAQMCTADLADLTGAEPAQLRHPKTLRRHWL